MRFIPTPQTSFPTVEAAAADRNWQRGLKPRTEPPFVWDCQTGRGWITNPALEPVEVPVS